MSLVSDIADIAGRRVRRMRPRGRVGESGALTTRRGLGQRTLRRLLVVAAGIAITAPVLLFWQANVGRLLDAAPETQRLDRLEVDLGPGASVTLGRDELAQPPGSDTAEDQHVVFERTRTGEVQLRNVARERRLFLEYANRHRTFAGRWQIAAGDSITVGEARIRFTAATATRLEMSLEAGRQPARTIAIDTQWNGDQMRVDGAPSPVCEAPRFQDDVENFVVWYMGRDERSERPVLRLGGRLTCLLRDTHMLAVPGVPWRGLVILQRGPRFYLAPGDPVSLVRPTVSFQRGNQSFAGFANLPWPLVHPEYGALASLVIGRTRYTVEIGQGTGRDRTRIVLRPQLKVHRFPVAPAAPGVTLSARETVPGFQNTDDMRRFLTEPRQVLSRGDGETAASGIDLAERGLRAGVVAIFLGLAVLPFLRRIGANLRRRRPDEPDLGAASPVFPAFAALVLTGVSAVLALAPEVFQLVGRPLSIRAGLYLTVANWTLATICLIVIGRITLLATLAWAAILMLGTYGSLVLLSLAIDGETTHWVSHLQKHKLLFLDLLPVVVTYLATVPYRELRDGLRTLVMRDDLRGRLMRAAPAVAVIGLLGAWLVFGNETGVGGFQPVEFGKVAMVYVLAMLLVGLEQATNTLRRSAYLSWLALAAVSVLIFVGVLFLVPFLKSDYSPVLIVIFVTIVVAFTFFFPWTLVLIRSLIRRIVQRADVPARGWPRIRRWPVGTTPAVVFTAAFVIASVLMVFIGNLANLAIVGRPTLPADRIERFEVLESARNAGGRRVPAERIMTWYDLDPHARLAPDERPEIRYRDLGFQLLRSKQALYFAPCGFPLLDWRFLPVPRLVGGDASFGILRDCDRVAGGVGREAPVPLTEPPPPPPERTIEQQEETTTLDPPPPPAPQGPAYSVRRLVQIPVIQNDFIGTYLVVRFGIGGALVFVLAQIGLMVATILALGRLRSAPEMNDAEQGVRRFLVASGIGVIALFAAHWAISWGNSLGLLPVMGQPMTWIAAATSHHLLMALPAVAILVVAFRYAAHVAPRYSSDPPDAARM